MNKLLVSEADLWDIEVYLDNCPVPSISIAALYEFAEEFNCLQVAVIAGCSEKVEECIARGDDVLVKAQGLGCELSVATLGLRYHNDFTAELVTAGHPVEYKTWVSTASSDSSLVASLKRRWEAVYYGA